jgi:hypothetical protein
MEGTQMFGLGKKKKPVPEPVKPTPITYEERMRTRVMSDWQFKKEDPHSDIVNAEIIIRTVNEYAENAKTKNTEDILNIARCKNEVEMHINLFKKAHEEGREADATIHRRDLEDAQGRQETAEKTIIRSTATYSIFSKIQPTLADLARYKDWKAIIDIFPKSIFDNINQNLDLVVDSILDALEKWHDEILLAIERQKELLKGIETIKGTHSKGAERLADAGAKAQSSNDDFYKSLVNAEKPKTVAPTSVKTAPREDVVVAAKPTIKPTS